MKQANLNLPVCKNIRSEALERVPAAKTKLLYTGYDGSKFVPEYNKDSIVLTVSIVDTYKRYEIKNVDFFLSVVETMPGIKFVAIGIEKRFIKGNIPENLIIIERIPQEEVLGYYQKASVYVLFSLREGLPNSVCEAMLCGCIPVGSNKGGIPTAIGDCGYILDSLDPKKAKENIEEALESSLEQRKAARQRIIENFSLDRRERNLSKLLKYYN